MKSDTNISLLTLSIPLNVPGSTQMSVIKVQIFTSKNTHCPDQRRLVRILLIILIRQCKTSDVMWREENKIITAYQVVMRRYLWRIMRGAVVMEMEKQTDKRNYQLLNVTYQGILLRHTTNAWKYYCLNMRQS